MNNEALFSNTPVRHITAKVSFFQNGIFAGYFNDTDRLREIEIQRIGEDSKFFGFGICQRLHLIILDVHRELNFTTADKFRVFFNDSTNFPMFHITETNRDEKTNELLITCYDVIEKAEHHTISELELESYTLEDLAVACAQLIGAAGIVTNGIPEFSLEYPTGANFDGAETIREVLNAVAEATQTIYYADEFNTITFKRLGTTDIDYTITKDDYMELSSKTNRRLVAICSATELGDNVEASLGVSGTTQYCRDNPLWELREDIATLVQGALDNVGGMNIGQFECEWRGNPFTQIGDRLEIITKDNQSIFSYLLNDTIRYNGGMTQKTQWIFTDAEETASNPATLGESLKQTYARVDKANKEITILASEIEAATTEISDIKINTESITAEVIASKQSIDDLGTGVNELTEQVELFLTSEEASILIQQELENGVDKVTTSTGFTFDDEGLTITKSESDISTQITEDGMVVSDGSKEVLTANSEGVKAVDLQATTYLVIGKNSRFEDLGSNRTACFFIR